MFLFSAGGSSAALYYNRDAVYQRVCDSHDAWQCGEGYLNQSLAVLSFAIKNPKQTARMASDTIYHCSCGDYDMVNCVNSYYNSTVNILNKAQGTIWGTTCGTMNWQDCKQHYWDNYTPAYFK